MFSRIAMTFAAAALATAGGALAQAPAPAAKPAAKPVARPAATGVQYATLKGDPVKGKADFVACKACHVVDVGVNRVGPSLHGIIGRKSGQIPGFKYSAANKNANIVWTPEVMFAYLQAPRKYIPGTYMTYAGLADPQKRANVIAYLKTQG